MAKWIAVLAVLVAAVCGSLRPERVSIYKRDAAPREWSRVGEASPGDRVQFFIALKQRNIELLEKVLYDVSHPYSPKYGEHWTFDQIEDLIAPPKEEHDQVMNWLLEHGVDQSSIVSRRDSLQIDTTVKVVEELFHTKMHRFVHETTRRKRIAHLGEISVPTEVAPLIEMVSALSLFPPTRQNKRTSQVEYDNTTPWIVASHLRQVYNIPDGLRATNPKTTQAAVEFEWPGCFSYTDITTFQQMVQIPFTNVSRIYPSSEWVDSGCDGESTMDLELMLTLGSGANTMYFTNENWIYEFSQTLMTMPNPPLVTSLSWGWMEAQQCDGLLNSYCDQLGVDSEQYVSRTNIELMKAGTMGLSVLVCTQDEGAPSDNNEDCSLDDTMPVWPIYPASSPYVTAVGATTLIANSRSKDNTVTGDWTCAQYICNNGTKEKVAMDSDMDTLFTSGGGFSNYTKRPSYQDTAVKQYMAKKDPARPPLNHFGHNGRGYPDISAAGSKTLIVLGGEPQWNGGTSASTPVTAGVISMLNDWRLNNGKKPLGFLNFLLYEMGQSYPQAFHDITVGNNTCTGWQDDTCCKYGYTALPGWDPTTGFGSPNYKEMINFISKLK